MGEFDMKPVDIAKRLTVNEKLQRVGTETGLSPRQANAITKARVNLALSQLAEANIDNVQQWLTEVGRVSPAEAIRLYMELMEFTTPRLKAAQVNLNANADLNPNGQRQLSEMSISELQSVIAEQ